MKRIKEQSIWDRPATQPKKRGMRNPSIAGDTERRIAMIALLRAFRAAYKCALEKYREGEDCVFPEGTWKMYRVYGAKVEGQNDPPARAA